MKNSMKLSICMMAKDEEKNLGRCLDGLKPILDKEDVELIIVDTGSTDKTVDIAHKYTDKVYHHPWNNHFSEMRNITISYATGEWILIIDADEVLRDAAELFKIITDSKTKSYNSIILKVRNLINLSGEYTTLPQERVFRNDGDFKYTGKVHNQPNFKPPVLNTEIYLEHYGYLYEDKELREKKFKRTGGILKELIKEDPGNPYNRFQMAKSYSAHGDPKEALDEIRAAYKLISGNESLMRSHMFIYGTYAILSFENLEFEESVKACEEGILLDPEYLDLYIIKGEALAKLNRNAEALDAFIKYITYANKYEKLAISANRGIEMCYLSDSFKDKALNFIANELYNQGRYEEASQYAGLLKDSKSRAVFLTKMYIKLDQLAKIRQIYLDNQDNKELCKILAINIEEEKAGLKPDKRMEIEKLFSEGNDLYALLNKARIASGSEREQIINLALKEGNFGGLPAFYAELFIEYDKNPRQFNTVFKTMGKTSIKNYVAKILDLKEEQKAYFENYLLNESIRNEDYQSLRLYVSIAFALLLREAVRIRNNSIDISDKYITIFKLYVERGIKYVSLLYNFERLRLYYSTLDDQEDKFFISINYALESVGRRDYKAGANYFLDAAKSNPYLACYMKQYKKDIFPDAEIINTKVE